MRILSALIPEGAANRPGRAMDAAYITIHETGNTAKGADAEAHAKYLLSDDARKRKVSWHYTVDDKLAVMHLPESESAFHAGDGAGPGNTRSIGIEICVNSDGNFEKAVRNACLLIAEIMLRRGALQIVQHNRWNGKDCPMNLRRSGWEEFLNRAREDYLALLARRAGERGFVNSPAYWTEVIAGETM